MIDLDSLLAAVGLPGIVAGVALEGEGVAFLGGVLAHRGLFPVEAAAFAATIGAALSDNAAFFAGRFAGRTALVERVLARGSVARLRRVLDRHPAVLILSFRFIYGARVASAILIGTTRVRWPLFLTLNLLSVVVWAHLITWLGYAGGLAIRRVFGHLEPSRHLAVAVAVAAVVAAVSVFAGRLVRRRALSRAGCDGRFGADDGADR